MIESSHGSVGISQTQSAPVIALLAIIATHGCADVVIARTSSRVERPVQEVAFVAAFGGEWGVGRGKRRYSIEVYAIPTVFEE